MSETSTTSGARDHARAQAAAEAERVVFKPTLPIDQARDLPPDLDPGSLVWDETLGPGGYASRVLAPGHRVRIVDLEGDACVNLLAYHAERPIERLNVADTVKVQWQAYPGEGALLLSDMGRVLLSIVHDSCGRHDAFCGVSAPWTEREGTPSTNHGPGPNGRERFLLALMKHGLGRRDLGPNLNLFKGVAVAPDGSLSLRPEAGTPGQSVELRAELPVLLVLANTPHVLDDRPGYPVTPVRVLGFEGEVAATDDPVRNATPERQRAFENVEDTRPR